MASQHEDLAQYSYCHPVAIFIDKPSANRTQDRSSNIGHLKPEASFPAGKMESILKNRRAHKNGIDYSNIRAETAKTCKPKWNFKCFEI